MEICIQVDFKKVKGMARAKELTIRTMIRINKIQSLIQIIDMEKQFSFLKMVKKRKLIINMVKDVIENKFINLNKEQNNYKL